MAIISSLLDTDLYKLTMQYAVLQKFPDLEVRYKFTDRNKTVYPKGFAQDLVYEIHKMGEICLTEKEEDYLRTLRFLPPTYIDFLRSFRFNPQEVKVHQNQDGTLEISIGGLWYRTILWEVPLMALISELYFQKTDQEVESSEELFQRDFQKAEDLIKQEVHFADFGTRRRFSKENHKSVIANFQAAQAKVSEKYLVGSSNVMLAQRSGLKPIGTMAHEWIMAHGALYGYKMSNKMALDNWVDVYRGDLGIALSDTYTTDAFFKIFDKKLAKLFDGVRHDSGDPYAFTNKVIVHYRNLGIDPTSKTIVFSDGLDVEKAISLKKYCQDRIKCSFGIGTHFTNDVGVKPLNIVIKLSEVLIHGDWYPAIKLSDDLGKHTGDFEEVKICQHILRL